MYNYLSVIDKKCIYLNADVDKGYYSGIDVQHSGFVTAEDTNSNKLFKSFQTLLNFDNFIFKGFERTKTLMKQIIPLNFVFDVNEIIPNLYDFCDIYVSGCWYDKNNQPLYLYDFSINYDEYTEQIREIDNTNGNYKWLVGNTPNFLDVSYPSVNECRYIKYQFSNKLGASFCRWKLESSDMNTHML